MAKLLKLRRGTTSQHNTFTGAEGEVTIDTTKDTAVVHDGSQAGGRPLAREDMSNVSSSSIAGRLGADSIATTKIAGGALPTDVTIASANIVNGTIAQTDMGASSVGTSQLAAGAVTNAKVSSSAAIAGTKVSPDFGSQNITTTGTIGSSNITITNTQPFISLQDTDNENDYEVGNAGGTFRVRDVDAGVNRLTITSGGTTTFANNVDISQGLDVTGNITVTGTVDGRDVAADGSKLDGIESGVTGDQTAAEIRTLVESASDSNVFTNADHTKLNGIESGATGDQTAAEIRTLVESASDSNVFTDADHSKLNGIESGATADQTGSEIGSLLNGVDVGTNGTGVANVYNKGWFRSIDNGDGMYNQSTNQHWYSDSNQYWNMGSGQTAGGIRFRQNHASTINGYVYYNNSNQIGFLNSGGTWSLKCDNSGNVTATGNVTAYSDARLKTNVNTINDALSIVGKLRGVSFDWIESGKRSIGVIAQEVEEVLPELVLTQEVSDDANPEKKEIKSVDYGKIVGVLINAINELKAEVDELKGGK